MSPDLQETCVKIILGLTFAAILWHFGKKLFFRSPAKCRCGTCTPDRRTLSKAALDKKLAVKD